MGRQQPEPAETPLCLFQPFCLFFNLVYVFFGLVFLSEEVWTNDLERHLFASSLPNFSLFFFLCCYLGTSPSTSSFSDLQPESYAPLPPPLWHGTASLCFFSLSFFSLLCRSGSIRPVQNQWPELSGGISCVSVKVTAQIAKVCQRLSILLTIPALSRRDGRQNFIRERRK